MTLCNCLRKNNQATCRIFNLAGMPLVLFANSMRVHVESCVHHR